MQGVDLGLHGFGIEKCLADLSLSLCLLAQTGSGDEVGGGAVFPRALNTLVPGLELLQGSLGTPDLCQWKEAHQQESLFLQWVDTPCESDPPQRRAFVPGRWEEVSPGSMSLGDVGGGVAAGKDG